MHNKAFKWRVIVISIFLTLILAVANAFLALKLGILTSASIPAAILSMGILRFFKHANIHENNLIQTAASAGEAVAGGIVYTIPALIIIGYWQNFAYWENFFLALISGLLGVLFSIPLRRKLVHHPSFLFPEGRAIAALLQNQSHTQQFKILAWGLVFGAFIDGMQTGTKFLSQDWHLWLHCGKSILLLEIGASIAMLGAGFLIGKRMAISIAIGAFVAWYVVFPYLSFAKIGLPSVIGPTIWNEELRFIGIGGLLLAGIISLLTLLRPLLNKIFQVETNPSQASPPSDLERDLPNVSLGLLFTVLGLGLIFLLYHILPLSAFSSQASGLVLIYAALFVMLFGLMMAVVTAYFSAMVGVSASPGSSVVISSVLLAAFGVVCISQHEGNILDGKTLLAAEAMVIILAAMVTGIAAISNDNMQDLKVGQLIGTSPWQQQLMLMLGVLVSALVIPGVMQILYHVYGIGGVNGLPAPTAVLVATMTKGFFQHILPWHLIGCGGLLILFAFLILHYSHWGLSIFGIAIGMYLPMETSTPLIIGGSLAYLIQAFEEKQRLGKNALQHALCFACGLVAGAAVMDVLLAFVFAWWGEPHFDAYLPPSLLQYQPLWTFAGLIAFIILGFRQLKTWSSAP